MVNHAFRLPHIVPHFTDLAVLTVNSVATGVVGLSGRQILRANRRTRLLGVLALLAGIVAMHSAVFAISGHTHATAGHGTVAVRFEDASSAQPEQRISKLSRDRTQRGHDGVQPGQDTHPTRPLDVAVLATGGAAPGPDCAGKGCGGPHGEMHGCVFILVAGAVLFALVLLYRMAVDRPGSGVALPRHWRPRRSRPPPWTVPTLAELAILRI
ncbi:DUF6153 family protein [Nocardia sp. 2YAB30]|uniref:DUF6153 family protein n=1 Tax=unclassified Nocardia TaxID=2637762 RepID=UPI003F99D5D7